MKLISTYANADSALADAAIATLDTELRIVLSDLVVPLFTGKSTKQVALDLVHPVLNAMVERWLELAGWQLQSVVSQLMEGAGFTSNDQGTVDFSLKLADGRYLAIEVQFGNAGRIERDFAKLRTLHEAGLLALGYVVCFDRATAITADSGLTDYETVVSKMGSLKDVPVCVIGLSREGSETVNLQEVPGIVFPTLLGGSGQNKSVRNVVAQQIVDRKPLKDLQLTPAHHRAIGHHAMRHVRQSLQVVMDDLNRVLQCEAPALRDALLASYTTFCRHSLSMSHAETAPVAASPKPTRSRAALRAVSQVDALPQVPSVAVDELVQKPRVKGAAQSAASAAAAPPPEGARAPLRATNGPGPMLRRAPPPLAETRQAPVVFGPAKLYHPPRQTSLGVAFATAQRQAA